MIIQIQKPELEDLILQRMANGGYLNVEDALIQALKSSSAGELPAAPPVIPKKTLGQFLLESPLRDSGLKLERRKDYSRPIDL